MYIVLQGSIPLRTEQFKQFLKLLGRNRRAKYPFSRCRSAQPRRRQRSLSLLCRVLLASSAVMCIVVSAVCCDMFCVSGYSSKGGAVGGGVQWMGVVLYSKTNT